MISHAVIKTKLYPPVSRTQLVYRTRLLQLLAENQFKKLTLVAAPAGFGKTTILGQWFEQRKQQGQHCCWCSLDHEDNNPHRFLRHIIAALRTITNIGEDVLRQLNTTLIQDITDTLPALVNELVDYHQDLILFIDDFHHITNEPINQFIELLINLSPPNFRLVIAGRIRPALSLSSLRVRNELCEILAGQLRFDSNEARDFMCDAIGLDLSAKQLQDLIEHSEGWAAGLQLASLSLHEPGRRDQFIASFSGSLRDIADYLTSDVLNQQPAEIKEFLLRTSILDRLCAGVCNAITGNNNGRELLERVESGNLFLVPLDDNQEWYRYHHLFQEFLLAQLRRSYPGEIVSLYKRAADWFAAAGLINEAVNYALLSGDTIKLGHLIQTGTMEVMSMDGRMAALLSWLDSIPDNIKVKFPRLLIQECIALSHLCRPLAAAETAIQARAAIRELPHTEDYHYTEAELEQIHSEQILLPFLVAFCKDDVEMMDSDVLKTIETQDDLILAIANNFLGYAALQKQQLAEAHHYLNLGRVHHIAKGTYYGAVFSDCFMVMSCLMQYRLHDAWEHAQAAEKLVEHIENGHIPGLAKAKVIQAAVLYEWNRIDAAVTLLEHYLPMIEDAGQIAITQTGLITLARCYVSKYQYDNANRLLHRCLQLSRHTRSDYINLAVELEQSRYAYLCGASIAVDNDTVDTVRELIGILEKDWNRTVFTRLLLLIQNLTYAGEAAQLPDIFPAAQALCARRGLTLFKMKLLLWEIIASIKLSLDKKASELLETVINLAGPELGIRIFLDAGDSICPLLIAMREKYRNKGDSVKQQFLQDLIAAFKLEQHTGNIKHKAGTRPVLIEPLSSREIEILALLAKGESNVRISTDLLISENTVKWHVKNIFAKLGVSNRTAAVVAAQQYQLIK